ncbi:MAG: hypothetical protein ACK4TC_06275 [Sphingomonas pseudosanguinis]
MAQVNPLRIVLQYDDDDMTLRSTVAAGMTPDQVYAMLSQAMCAHMAAYGALPNMSALRVVIGTEAADDRLACPCGQNGCFSPVQRV